jgi:hypothetical protein
MTPMDAEKKFFMKMVTKRKHMEYKVYAHFTALINFKTPLLMKSYCLSF